MRRGVAQFGHLPPPCDVVLEVEVDAVAGWASVVAACEQSGEDHGVDNLRRYPIISCSNGDTFSRAVML